MDAIYSNAYLVSYADKFAISSTLQVVKVDENKPDTGSVMSTLNTNNFFYQVLTLKNGLFVGITQDASEELENAYIIAGSVNSANYQITVNDANPVRYASNYSMNPQITR